MVETRTIVYDEQLQIEAYQFVGIMQKFPNHFHDCYVVSFVEKGNRHLSCRGDEYDMEPGDMLLLNPRDNHTCESRDGQPLDYRCLNIDADVMVRAVKEVIGYTNNQPLLKSRFSEPIKLVKKHLDDNFINQISLDSLSELAQMNKYTLIRNFARSFGITPYQYLETIRVNHAKELLEQGLSPLEAAMLSGFSDRSHFTRFFKSLIGLTPKQYQNIFKGKEDE